MDGPNYWQRLEVLNMFSLERRRERFLMTYVWRMVNGLSPEIKESQGSELRVMYGERKGKRCELPRIDRRAQLAVPTQLESSLPVQGVRLFNSLPRELKEFEGSPTAFKRHLNECLRTVLDRPYLPHYPSPFLTNSLAGFSC